MKEQRIFVIWDLKKNNFGQKKPKFYKKHDWALTACSKMNEASDIDNRYVIVPFSADMTEIESNLIVD